jgi:hypothetical protein
MARPLLFLVGCAGLGWAAGLALEAQDALTAEPVLLAVFLATGGGGLAAFALGLWEPRSAWIEPSIWTPPLPNADAFVPGRLAAAVAAEARRTAEVRAARAYLLDYSAGRWAARQRYRRRARRIEAHPRLTSFSRRFTAHGRRARRSKDALELALAKALSHLWDLVEREQARAWWEDYEGGFDRAMMETLEGSIPQRADETEATYALRLRAVERAYRARLSNYTRAPARSGTPLREAA